MRRRWQRFETGGLSALARTLARTRAALHTLAQTRATAAHPWLFTAMRYPDTMATAAADRRGENAKRDDGGAG